MILSMTLVTNVIFLFLYTCVAIPFKVITCCFAFFFQPLSSMPSAKSTQSKTDASSSSSNSSNPSTTVPLRPASAQKTPTNHSFILSRSSTQRIVTSTSSPPMKFNPVVVSWFYYSLFFQLFSSYTKWFCQFLYYIQDESLTMLKRRDHLHRSQL